jgi:diacylglycerol kinase family enzyme
MIDFILNPTAGDGRSLSRWGCIEPVLNAAGVRIKLHTTAAPGHATEIAAQIRHQPGKIVVAVGGDGTVHEVASALRGTQMVLGIIPTGNGNDYARAHGIHAILDH